MTKRATSTPRPVRPLLDSTQKLLDRETYVFGDLAKQRWGNVSTTVKRNCRSPAIRMPILLVGTPLPISPRNPGSQGAPPPLEVSGWAACPLSYPDCLYAHELGLERWFAVLEQHANNFLQVALQFVQTIALAVRTGPARNVADE